MLGRACEVERTSRDESEEGICLKIRFGEIKLYVIVSPQIKSSDDSINVFVTHSYFRVRCSYTDVITMYPHIYIV